MTPAPRWGYTGLLLGLFAAIGVWVVYQAGWLASWEGVFYDRALAWTARWRDPSPKVLLLRMEHEDGWSEAEAIKALEILEGFGARSVAIDFLPRKVSPEFFRRTSSLGNVVFGRELQPDPDDPDRLKLENWPEAARGSDPAWGVVYLPPSLKGVYRWQHTRVATDEGVQPTLEGRVAALWGVPDPGPPGAGRFLVDFGDGPGALPNVSLTRLLAGELVPDLVKGKAVLIGGGRGLLGLETPVSGGAEPMTFLEFQGNALQTLLNRTPIRLLSWGWALLLLAGLGVGSSLLYQRANSVAGARLALGILLVCGVGALGMLWFFRIWPPLGAVVLAQGAQYGLTLLFRTRMTHRALNEMRLRSLNQIKARYCPESPEQSPEYWDHLATMIHQMLEVNRMVFFERIPRSSRLEGIKAVNCGFEELREKERTLEAPVFAVALAKGGPVRISGFLPEGPDEEYLCPLIYAGEVLGVWVLGIDPSRAAAIQQLDGVLIRFSQQIARLLYQKKRATPRPTLAARLREWFSTEKEDQAYRELRATADILEQHYDVLEAVLSQIGTAMIAYDFFGRVLKINEPALALLQAENFVPNRATALDLVRLVTGMGETEARSLLRNVLLDRAPMSMSVRLASQGERQHLLRVFPLTEPKLERPDPANPEVRGLVCELIETTSLSTLASIKGVVADRLGVELRDHLAAIEMSASLLESERFAPGERQRVLEAIHTKTHCCVQVINECQKYLGRGVDAYAIDCFPLDALELLGRACTAASRRAAERRITLTVEQPRLMDQVMASSFELLQVFSITLDLLIRDAAERTAVSIQVEDTANTTVFRFSNCGFGIPNERLQSILTGHEIPGAEEFQVLREAVKWVRKWEGSLEVTSDVGKGFSVKMELRQFKLATTPPLKPA